MIEIDSSVEIMHASTRNGETGTVVSGLDSGDCYMIEFADGEKQRFYKSYVKLVPLRIGQEIIIAKDFHREGKIGKIKDICGSDPTCRIVILKDGTVDHYPLSALLPYKGKGLKSSKEEPHILLKINIGNQELEKFLGKDKIAYNCARTFLYDIIMNCKEDKYGQQIKIDKEGVKKLREIFPLSLEEDNVFTIDTGIYLMGERSYVSGLYTSNRMKFFERFFKIALSLNKIKNIFKNKEIYIKFEFDGVSLRDIVGNSRLLGMQNSLIIVFHGRNNYTNNIFPVEDRYSWYKPTWGKPIIYNQIVGGTSKIQNGITVIELCINTIFYMANRSEEEAEKLLHIILELAYKKDPAIQIDSEEAEKQLKEFFSSKNRNIKDNISTAHIVIADSMCKIKQQYDKISEMAFQLTRLESKTDEIKTLSEVNGVKHVFLSEEKILIITKDIVFGLENFEGEPLELPMGPYLISIDVRNTQISVIPYADKVIHPFHPYITRNGKACYGNYKEFIIEALGEMDYHNLVGYLLEWLEKSYNTTERPENDLQIFIKRATRIRKKQPELTQREEDSIRDGISTDEEEEEEEEENTSESDNS